MATPSQRHNDNDILFGNDESHSYVISFAADKHSTEISFVIFNDEQVENTEAVQFTLGRPDNFTYEGLPIPLFRILPHYSNFYVIIEDEFRKHAFHIK